MPNSESLPPAHPRVDDEEHTVVDPTSGVWRDSAGARESLPAGLEDEKTVISQRPPSGASWAASATANELGALLEGKQLGHFTLEKFVGGGGMGAVFRGRDNLLGRIVAVKVLSRDQGADPETLRRFKNEAQSAARLDHDNIARVFFVGEDEGWNYIVFEFIDGVNIRDLVERDGPLSIELAIDFTMQVAEALAHAAEREVVHRDIKPSNILVTHGHHAKLVDMGLARLHHLEAGESDLTASGVTLGTFDYISPEQASDPRRADVRSDMYSLGCTLFYMLTGRPPFPQGTVLQKLLAHSGEAPPDPRMDRPDLPEGLSRIVLRLMAKRPDQRYREPAELIGELLVLRDRLGLARYDADSPWVAENLSPPWQDRAVAWGAPVVLLVVVFFAFNAYWSNWSSRAEALPAFRRPAEHSETFVDAPSNERAPAADQRESGAARDDVDDSRKKEPATERPTTTGDGSVEPPASDSEKNGSTPPAAVSTTDDTSRVPVKPATEASSGAAATTPSASAQPAVIYTVVIGNAAEIGELGEGVAIYASLDDALSDKRIVEQLAQIRLFEIRAPLVVERDALDINLPKDSELTIRGVPDISGELPVVRFVAPAAASATQRDAALALAGGKVTFDNLHLQLSIEGPNNSADVALIRLTAEATTDLEFERCVVTIDNAALDNPPPTSVIDVEPALADRERSVVPVSLRNTIVRGRAMLVRMRQSQGLDLLWNNGVFISNQPLLLAEGNARSMAASGGETIRLRLDKVTAATTGGLCLLRDSNEQPNQPDLEFVSNRCIIAADGSLVEHNGVHELTDYAKALRVAGSNNFYEDTRVFWRVYSDNVEQQKWDWATWRDHLLMERGGMSLFYSEVHWSRPRSDVLSVAVHERGIDDYTLDPIASKKAMNDDAGFDAKLLPPLVRLPLPEKPPASPPSESPSAPTPPAP